MKLQKIALATGMVLSMLLSTGFSKNSKTPPPMNITDKTRCTACNMLLLDYPGPHAQVIYSQHHHLAYHYYGNLSEAMFEVLQSKHPIKAVYVQAMDHHDFKKMYLKDDWIRADSAYYVVDSHQYFIMGPGYFPFKTKRNAHLFTKKHGGKVFTFSQMRAALTKKTIAPLNSTTNSMRNMNMWMFSVMPMYMDMNGFKSGASNASPSSKYMMYPGHMQMSMLMFMAMYMTKDGSFMLMGSYNRTDMDMYMGGKTTKSTMRTEGFGDTQLIGSLYPINTATTRLEYQFGLSLPTGRINYSGLMDRMQWDGPLLYGYPMQMGSGTFDPILGVSYTRYQPKWTLSTDFTTLQRLYNNYKGYRLGSVYTLSFSADYLKTRSWLFGGKLSAQYTAKTIGWQDSKGKGDPTRGVAYDPANTGGTTVMAYLNTKYQFTDRQSIGPQMGIPIYQYKNGIQMKELWQASLNYTAMFS